MSRMIEQVPLVVMDQRDGERLAELMSAVEAVAEQGAFIGGAAVGSIAQGGYTLLNMPPTDLTQARAFMLAQQQRVEAGFANALFVLAGACALTALLVLLLGPTG